MTTDRKPGKYLNTLALRCTPDLVGDATVHVRHLDTETRKLWDDFDQQCKKRFGSDSAQAPYSIATTVLSVVAGGYVYFDPDWRNPFLASRSAIPSQLLERVFTLTYHLALGERIEAIDLTRPPELAKRIAATPEIRHHLAEALPAQQDVQPDAPGWVYRTVTWDLAKTLAAAPWPVNAERKIGMRPDTTGGLVADPAADYWENEQGGRYALCRTDLRLKTLPNIIHPVLLLDSRVSRISPSLVFAATALAVQPGDRPILQIALNGRGGARTINRLALTALGRLEMDYTVLNAISARSEREQQLLAKARATDEKPHFAQEHPGSVWPILPVNRGFPIGTGVGMEHLRLLHDHVFEVFGEAATPLTARSVAMRMPHRPTDPEHVSPDELARRKAEREKNGGKEPLKPRGSGFPEPEAVYASIQAEGMKKLQIACLWYRDEARLRMLSTLAKAYGLDPVGLDPHDGQEIQLLGDRITAVFHRASDLLAPGGPGGRIEALARIKDALGGDGVLAAAWCETEIPGTDGDGQEDAPVNDPADFDAKYQTRPLFAARSVPNQYLRGMNGATPVRQKDDDHPAQMSLLDLYRNLGVVDSRIADALTPNKGAHPVDRAAHVGIHIRQQNNRKGEFGSPKVVITAAALVPPAVAGGVWTMIGWSSTKPTWQPYRLAQTAFHATEYATSTGVKKSYRERWDEAAEAVELALTELAEHLDGVPYVVTIDEAATRRMWAGLQNINQGGTPDRTKSRYWLPGSTLQRDEQPDAVIRINIEDEEVPQPVGTFTIKKDPHADPSEGDTAQTLYRIDSDFGSPSWILCNVPRNWDGGTGGRRLGAKYTRWDAAKSVYDEDDPSKRRKGEIPQPWYAMTASSIYPIVYRNGVPAEAFAIVTAKLCHQTLFWNDRARYPVPLHAARQMDLDHPQYRRTVPPEEKPIEELGMDTQQ